MLVWVSVKTFCQCLIQYAWFLLQHNPLAILVQRQRRLGFVENYGEVLIKPKVKERVLDMFLTGTYMSHLLGVRRRGFDISSK